MSDRRALFVGIGSPHGDDQIGWLVADAIRKQQLDNVDVLQISSPSDLLDTLADYDQIFLCDACQADVTSSDGALIHPRKWTWPTPLVASVRSAGSHSFGLPQVLELAEKLGSLPPQVVIYGIPAEHFGAFTEVSLHLRENLAAIVDEIVADLISTCNSETTAHA